MTKTSPPPPALHFDGVCRAMMTVGGKLSKEYGSGEFARWINTKNMGFVLAVTMFGVT